MVALYLFQRKLDHIPFLHCLKEEVHGKELLHVNKSTRYQDLNRINTTSRTSHCN